MVMTLVLPDPAPARTRVASSSTTTDRRCSCVSGLLSMVSKKSFHRSSSAVTNAAMAFARAARGSEANFRTVAIRATTSGPMASAFSFDRSDASRALASSMSGAILHAASPSTPARTLSSRAASLSRATRLTRVQASLTSSANSLAATCPAPFSVTSLCSCEFMVSAVPSIPFRRSGACVSACSDTVAT